MRLTLVSGEFPPMQGGVGDYTREMAREFTRRGIAVQVVAPASRSEPVEATAEASRALPAEGYRVLKVSFASWRSLADIDRLTRDQEIVHIQYQAAAYGMTPPIHCVPRYLRWRHPRRCVPVTFHDLRVPYLFPKAGALRWRAVQFLARSCHAVVVTNQADEQALATQLRGISPLRLIPIGSNIDASSGASPSAQAAAAGSARELTRAALGVRPDECLLCYFGFLNASKGGETLVRVLARVRDGGRAARLLMLGGEVGASDPTNQAYAEKVKAIVAELGLTQHVLWSGYRAPAEVSALWRACDVALLPYVDGASLRRGTLMAALAHGMPIVSTVPQVPVPQLRDGENIALAPPDDVQALAARVSVLCASPGERARLARGAAALAQEFAWERIADRHLELYRELGL